MDRVDEQIGGELRAAREELGRSLHEAGEATKIKSETLREMEAGDFRSIPAAIYVRGFLRTYAEYLGLDGEALVERYVQAHREPAPFVVPEPSAPGPRRRGPAPGVAAPAPAGAAPAPERAPERFPAPPWLWAAAVGFALLAIAVTVLLVQLTRQRRQAAFAGPAGGELGRMAEHAAVVDLGRAEAALQENPAAAAHRLLVRAEARTWLGVRVAGELVLERFVDSGFEQEWTGPGFQLVVGVPRAVRVEVDGVAQPLGGGDAAVIVHLEPEPGAAGR